jgi:hypothetical protein
MIEFLLMQGVGATANYARLQMLRSFIATLGRYATCIMRSLRRSSRCYWSAVDCDGQATVVEVG